MAGLHGSLTILASLALLAHAPGCAIGRSDVGVAKRLAAIAEANECIPFGGASASGDAPEPSWLSLEAVTGGPDDYVLVCSSSKKPISLVILDVRSPNNPWKGCPAVVGEIEWLPSGLSVLSGEDAGHLLGPTLSAWQYPEGSPGPADVEITRPVIDTTADIAGMMFYCHAGQWLHIFHH